MNCQQCRAEDWSLIRGLFERFAALSDVLSSWNRTADDPGESIFLLGSSLGGTNFRDLPSFRQFCVEPEFCYEGRLASNLTPCSIKETMSALLVFQLLKRRQFKIRDTAVNWWCGAGAYRTTVLHAVSFSIHYCYLSISFLYNYMARQAQNLQNWNMQHATNNQQGSTYGEMCYFHQGQSWCNLNEARGFPA